MFPDFMPDRPTGQLYGSVQTGTNADLMATVAPTYLTGSVLDVTYGEGKWWDRFTPDPFTFHDLHKVDGVDFRALPHDDNSFDAVCFDPPYVISGGPSSPALNDGEFQGRYGIGIDNLGDSSTAAGFHDLVRRGLHECIRVSRGWVLVKCMEFAQGSGPTGFHDMPTIVTNWAADLGAAKYDQIVHHTGPGPGGHNIWTQKRARRHHSYLIVFSKLSPARSGGGAA